MKKNLKKSGGSRLLTEEEKKELCQNSIKRIRPVLDALTKWAAESLVSPFRY